jgi:transposase
MNDSLILGVDPAKEKFTAAFFAADDSKPQAGRDFPMTRQGLDDLGQAIAGRLAADQRLVVGVEATAALDDNLLAWFAAQRQRWPLLLLQLDPGQVARFSGARPVRGKTDKADARRIAAFTAAHARHLDAFERDAEAQSLTRLVHERGALAADRAALKNRLRDRLVISFPEFTGVFDDPSMPMARAVLRKAPTAKRAAACRATTLARVAPEGEGAHALGMARAEKLRALGRGSIASATFDDDADAIVFMLDQIELIGRRVAAIDRALIACQAGALAEEAALAKAAASASATNDSNANATSTAVSIPRQIARLAAMRGVGAVGAATIVLSAGGLARFTSAKALAAQMGACPERLQTGKTMDKGRLTHRGDRRARSMLYMLALTVTQFDPGLAFHKFMMRRRGHQPKQALCACMNRLARIMWAVATGPSAYDPRRVIENAQRHHAGPWKEFVDQTRHNRKLWKGHEEFIQ